MVDPTGYARSANADIEEFIGDLIIDISDNGSATLDTEDIEWLKRTFDIVRAADPTSGGSMKALFIPLKAKHFDAFADGSKDTEYRVYGPRWNEGTCAIGRPVMLSRGYGTAHRLRGEIVGFECSKEPTTTEAWRDCYGDQYGLAACIRIRLAPPQTGNP